MPRRKVITSDLVITPHKLLWCSTAGVCLCLQKSLRHSLSPVFHSKVWHLVYWALLFSFLFLAEPLPFTPGGGKSFIMGSDDMLESVLGLGDLADLTVSNDEAEYSYDVSTQCDRLLLCFYNTLFWH